MAIFQARHLSKTYRAGTAGEVRALSDVALEVPAGSFVLLTGPSGAGKTTLLAILGALERPSAGQLLFAERDLSRCSGAELARIRRRIGFIFQDFALIPGLSVAENITYPLIPRGLTRAEQNRLAQDVLSRLGLVDKAMSRPSELSGGEQQRVAIARAFAGNPEALLADEPTSNLHENAGETIIELLRQAHAEGKTVVVSSHDTRLRRLATDVFELASGRLKRED